VTLGCAASYIGVLRLVRRASVLAVLALVPSGCGFLHQASRTLSTGAVADRAITHLRAEWFRSFPGLEGRTGCVLRAGTGRRFSGTCQTRVSHAGRFTVVTFTEFWPAAKFRTDGPPRGVLRHSWSYEIRANGRIVLRGERGALPPQYDGEVHGTRALA